MILRSSSRASTAPWPAYDTIITAAGVSTATVAKRIVETVETIGADHAYVAAYERENQNREEVLAKIAARAEEKRKALAEIEALSA
jgi:hypothetical protein